MAIPKKRLIVGMQQSCLRHRRFGRRPNTPHERFLGTFQSMGADPKRFPAAKVMDEAIDLAIEGRSPYPEKAAFIDANAPSAGHAIERAADEGLAIVLVSTDGSTRVLRPDLAAH